ncbi:Lysosome-associated membrane glycoprotein 1 [Mactra antiquata]
MAGITGKLALLIVVFGLLHHKGDAATFEFNGGTGTPCILVNMDATFNLSRTVNTNETQIADAFTLEGANVTGSQSKCGDDTIESLLTLTLFPSSETFKIKFVKVTSTQDVLISVILNVQPDKHFEDPVAAPFEMEDDGDLPIGQRNMSFLCYSEQVISFGQDPGYFMTMKITNMQIQGYEITNGQFSPALECDKDKLTTSSVMPDTSTSPMEPTTESTPVTSNEPVSTSVETPATLEPESTTPTTTEPETTVTTEPTTPAPEPAVPKYDVGNDTVKCLVIQGEFGFNINYMKTGEKPATQNFKIPEAATFSGSCSVDGSADTEELIITFNDNWTFTVQVARPSPQSFQQRLSHRRNLLAEDSTYYWTNLTLVYEVNDQYFEDPDPSEIGRKTVNKPEDEGIFQANTQGSYKCIAAEQVQMDNNVQMEVTKLQYKAFGEDADDNFPDEGVEECAADKDDDDDDDDNTVAIVLGSVFGGLALILLIAVIIIVRRRKSSDYEVM